MVVVVLSDSAVPVHLLKDLEVSRLAVTLREDGLQVVGSDALQRHKHQHMIGQIGDFPCRVPVLSILGGGYYLLSQKNAASSKADGQNSDSRNQTDLNQNSATVAVSYTHLTLPTT